jgi:hypothetical protein
MILFWLALGAVFVVFLMYWAYSFVLDDDVYQDEEKILPSRYVDPGVLRPEDHASARLVYRASSRTARR